jgi:hypothetical protein
VLMVVANTVLILPSRTRERQWRALWQGIPRISLVIMLATIAGLWVVTQVAPVAAAFRFIPLAYSDWSLAVAGGLVMLLLFQMVKLPPKNGSVS